MAGLFRQSRVDYVKKIEKQKKAEAKKQADATFSGGRSAANLISTINQIKLTVQTNLSKYKDKYLLLTTEEDVTSYFDDIVDCKLAAIDTETTGLDTLSCKLVGLCLYVEGKKPCYIPVNHVGHITKQRLAGQISEEFLNSQLSRCDDVKWVFHNAKFDIRVLRHTVGIDLKPYWDTMAAAKLLNENESAALKNLHLKYCDSLDEKALTISVLFDNLNFALIPIDCAYLYAAGDAIKTFELYKFQKKFLDMDSLKGPKYVFDNIEMPIIPVLADMEDCGIHVDMEYAHSLQEKYHKLLDEAEKACYDCLAKYQTQIDLYKRLTPNHKLSNPISLGSPTQVAIILYDVLKLKPKTLKDLGRKTGEDVLLLIDHEFPKLLLKYREMAKLISTYVDKLPEIVNPGDGRIHCSFNAMGAKTGRMSSSDPNLQNIPSHNKDIRKMFTASPGYYLVSGDYSQQEVRVLAYICGDENMRKAYEDDMDIYAWIGSMVYNVPYEECKEFYPDGTTNPEGKKRRTSMKSVVLGLMYSRGAQGIAEQLNISLKEAQSITNSFYDAFPKIKECIDSSHKQAHDYGFVETVCGRKRRLPEMQLPEFDFKIKDASKLVTFDALDFDFDSSSEPVIPEERKQYYWAKMHKAYGWAQKQRVKAEAAAEGIEIIDNGGKIADASRQCLNCVDKETEILTTRGWMHYNEIREGDEILSFNVNTRKIEKDHILKIHNYDGVVNVTEFSHPSFSAVTTGNHRWPVWTAEGKIVFKTSNDLSHRNWPDYHILRCGDNDFKPAQLTDSQLYLIGLFLIDGTLLKQARGFAGEIFQSKKPIISKIDKAFEDCELPYVKRVNEVGYCTWYMNQSEWTNWLGNTFPDRVLTADFILSLSQYQAQFLIEAMVDGDGTRNITDTHVDRSLCCGTSHKADMFQMLCVVAGYGSSKFECNDIGNEGYSNKVSNKDGIVTIRNKYYNVRILSRSRVHVYPKRHCSETVADGVWCVTTNNETWIARRRGKIYITGNSRIQGQRIKWAFIH